MHFGIASLSMARGGGLIHCSSARHAAQVFRKHPCLPINSASRVNPCIEKKMIFSHLYQNLNFVGQIQDKSKCGK